MFEIKKDLMSRHALKKFCLVVVLCITNTAMRAQTYTDIDGKVTFISNAPLEFIMASSNVLQGVFDVSGSSFAFKISIRSFEGFNSPLQKEHFSENYMETDLYPTASFYGKLLEPIGINISAYRAKGKLNIHGVEKEVILPVNLVISETSVQYQSSFKVFLEDFNIEIPRIVFQKIAEEIEVSVEGVMEIRE